MTVIASPRQPLTVVEQGATSISELQDAVLKTRVEHAQTLEDYHKAWYESGHTWHYTQFLGVGLMKCPNDLWMYQDLMTHYKPKTIIETGTYQGGSALWFAALADLLNLETEIYTIDIKDYVRCAHPRIHFIIGDSTDAEKYRAGLWDIEHPLLVVLDADHSAAHVKKELDIYAPMCAVGDWLVVEDTNIGWPGEGGDRGAAGGLSDYLAEHPGEWRQDLLCERYLLTMNPGGWMQRVLPYQGA